VLPGERGRGLVLSTANLGHFSVRIGLSELGAKDPASSFLSDFR
jgi:hypothetical protein